MPTLTSTSLLHLLHAAIHLVAHAGLLMHYLHDGIPGLLYGAVVFGDLVLLAAYLTSVRHHKKEDASKARDGDSLANQ
jgi:hypothetical protein